MKLVDVVGPHARCARRLWVVRCARLSMMAWLWSTTSAYAQDAGATPNEADAGTTSVEAADAGAPPQGEPGAPESVAPEAAAPIEAAPTASTPVPTEPAAPVVEGTPGPLEVGVATPADVAENAIAVTVVGTPLARTPGSAHVIRSRQLERFEYDDPHAVLSSVPGVYVRGEDGVGLRPNIGIRGVDPDRSAKITLMEDGILFGPAPYSAPAAYFFPLITRMTQVRVVKGPGATSYGPQTIGGAVDLITRPIPASLSGAADLTLGSYLHRKAHVHMGTSDGRVGFLIEGIHLANDGFKELPNGGDTGFYRNEWMFKGAYNLDDTGAAINELRLKLTYSEELSNETYLGITDADFARNPLQRYQASALDQMKNHRTAFVLSHVYEPNEELSITTNVYRHDYARTWRKVNGFGAVDLYSVLSDPDSPTNANYHALLTGEVDSMGADQQLWIGPNEREFVSQGIESRLRWSVATGPLQHQVGASARFHHDQIDRRHSESPFDLIGGEVFPVGVGTTNDVRVTTVNHGYGDSLALSVGDAISWGALTVTPSARLEVMRLGLDDTLAAESRAYWFVEPIPGLGAYYGLTDELGVLAGVYRGFSAPSPSLTDFSDDVESSANIEAGVRYSGRKLHAELIGFFNEYGNLTSTCTFSTGCEDDMIDVTFSAGAARFVGFEAQVEHELSVGAFKVPFQLSYSFTHAEFLDTFTSARPAWGEVEKGDGVPYVPNHQLNAAAGVEHKRGGGNVALSFQGATREQPGQEAISSVLHTDAQLTVDVSLFYQVLDSVRVYANVRNLFDSMYVVSHRPFGARPNAPRWIQLGAKIEL